MSDIKLALVTGATRGIGYYTALTLANKGYHIIAIGRTQGALEELDDEIQKNGGSATLVPLDLTDFEAIDRMAASIAQRWGKLDALVGNAGILGKLMPVGHMKPELFDEVIATNLTANWRLLRAFDLLLKQSEAGRAVFVTSSVARNPHAFWGAYAMSKAALENMVQTYARESDASSVCANIFDPGATATNMRSIAMPGEDETTLPSPKDVGSALAQLALPETRQNGQLYSYEQKAWV